MNLEYPQQQRYADQWRPEVGINSVEARHLSRNMGNHSVLERVNLTISRGEIVALVGANGAGKTTLLRCLAGQLRPNLGEVLWFGSSSRRCPAAHKLLGFAAHESNLYPELTVQENLLFAARMYGVVRVRECVSQLLKNSDLEHWAEHSVRRLSKGVRQRASLIRALVHDPAIVILDEPFSGLDVDGRRWLETWLSDLRDQNRAICFTSHDRQQCQRLADRAFELRDRKLRRCDECH